MPVPKIKYFSLIFTCFFRQVALKKTAESTDFFTIVPLPDEKNAFA